MPLGKILPGRCVEPVASFHWKKIFKNLMSFTPFRNGYLVTFKKLQMQPPKVFYKKAVIKNFAIFTGKHLCWSLFLIQIIPKFLRAPI